MTDPKSQQSHGKTPGAVTTYSASGKGTDGNQVVHPEPRDEVHSEPPLSFDEVKGLVGELKPGEFGWVKLSDEGEPTGAATKEPPAPGSGAYARVSAPNYPKERDELTTPSGAPIMPHMNPNPDLWDAGLLERNPINGSPKPAKNAEHSESDKKASK